MQHPSWMLPVVMLHGMHPRCPNEKVAHMDKPLMLQTRPQASEVSHSKRTKQDGCTATVGVSSFVHVCLKVSLAHNHSFQMLSA